MAAGAAGHRRVGRCRGSSRAQAGQVVCSREAAPALPGCLTVVVALLLLLQLMSDAGGQAALPRLHLLAEALQVGLTRALQGQVACAAAPQLRRRLLLYRLALRHRIRGQLGGVCARALRLRHHLDLGSQQGVALARRLLGRLGAGGRGGGLLRSRRRR